MGRILIWFTHKVVRTIQENVHQGHSQDCREPDRDGDVSSVRVEKPHLHHLAFPNISVKLYQSNLYSPFLDNENKIESFNIK
jgi:hypothetical protein